MRTNAYRGLRGLAFALETSQTATRAIACVARYRHHVGHGLAVLAAETHPPPATSPRSSRWLVHRKAETPRIHARHHYHPLEADNTRFAVERNRDALEKAESRVT